MMRGHGMDEATPFPVFRYAGLKSSAGRLSPVRLKSSTDCRAQQNRIQSPCC